MLLMDILQIAVMVFTIHEPKLATALSAVIALHARACQDTTIKPARVFYVRNDRKLEFLLKKRLDCGNGIVDNNEECDGSANCLSSCTCANGLGDNGLCAATAIPLAPVATTPESNVIQTPVTGNDALIGGVVGGVGGALVILAIILIVLGVKGKLKKKKKNEKHDVEAGNGIYGPIGGPKMSSNFTNKTIELENLAPEDRLKIPYHSLVFKQEIGVGGFGKVFVGEWQRTKVAIKVATVASAEDFTREAKLSV